MAASEWHDEDLAFAQPKGRPNDKKINYDNWKGLLQSAGVHHARLHDGLHTAATLGLSDPPSPRGHGVARSQPDTTATSGATVGERLLRAVVPAGCPAAAALAGAGDRCERVGSGTADAYLRQHRAVGPTL